MNQIKKIVLALGLSVAGLVALAPASAFARGAAPHGGAVHAAPMVRPSAPVRAPAHGAPVYRGAPAAVAYPHGYADHRGPMEPRGGFAVRPVPARPVPGRVWVPGYWGLRAGARIWIEGAYMTPPTVGWVWVAPHWTWNGVQWVWAQGAWAPPQY